MSKESAERLVVSASHHDFKGAEMHDPTETIRRQRLAEINGDAGERQKLETRYGQVWSADQLTADFEVIGFMAPFVVARRRTDGVKGSLEFQHNPRFYFNFKEA